MAETVPKTETQPGAGRAEVIDIVISQPLTRAVFMTMGAFTLGVSVLCMIICDELGYGSLRMPVFLAGVVIAQLVGGRQARRYAHRAVDRVTTGNWADDIRDAVEKTLEDTQRVQPMAAIHELMRRAARAGALGVAIRIGQRDRLGDVQPIEVPFEPQVLDESDPVLQHLSGQCPTVSGARSDPSMRRLLRNISLHGGWWATAIAAAGVAVYAIRAWRTGSVGWELVLFGLLLMSVLTGPISGLWSRPRQMLAVTGGLLLRRGKRTDDHWKVRLFTQSNSSISIYQAGTRQWWLAVADDKECGTWSGTKTEIEFALRAWLSPLEPPPLDRLKEFA